MDSSLPWFMFWMKKMMEGLVGNDYERGLNLLKDYAEDGMIHSKINWLGESQFPGCDYIGIKRACTMQEMPTVMQKDFEDLMSYSQNIEGADKTMAFSMYHKFDFAKQSASYTAGIPVSNVPSDIPAQFFIVISHQPKFIQLSILDHMITWAMHGLQSIP